MDGVHVGRTVTVVDFSIDFPRCIADPGTSLLFWIALTSPVLKLPLHTATLEPFLYTAITCPARSSTNFVFLSRVDLRDSANQT
jgi:hypothetical protein